MLIVSLESRQRSVDARLQVLNLVDDTHPVPEAHKVSTEITQLDRDDLNALNV